MDLYWVNSETLKEICDNIKYKLDDYTDFPFSEAADKILQITTGVDVSQDTVVPSVVLQGYTFHNGSTTEQLVGTYEGGGSYTVSYNSANKELIITGLPIVPED